MPETRPATVPAEHVPAVATPGRVGQATAVEQSRAVAEVQAAIVVAQQVPRSLTVARTAMTESCELLSFAEAAFYSYPKGGSTVTGASVYLARELARCFGNVQYGVNELRRDDDHRQSEMQAWAWDVQMNTRSSTTFIVPHMRDKRGGPVPLVDLRDVYENNANQGARRLRQVIFSILPTWFVAEAEDICRATLAHGDGKPIPERIEGAIKAFAGLDVSQERLEQKLGKPRERWNAFDLAQLRITHRSIERGEVSVDDEFPQARVTADEITAPQPAPPATTPAAATPPAACTPSAPCGACDMCQADPEGPVE